MAAEVKTAIDTFKPPENDDNPASTNHTSSNSIQDTSSENTQLVQACTEKTGPGFDNGLWQPTSRASDADLNWPTHVWDHGHANTPPIDVPRPKAEEEEQQRIVDNSRLEDGLHDNDYHQESSPNGFMRNGSPSVSLRPEDAFDSGYNQTLGKSSPNLTIDITPISTSELDELDRFSDRSYFQRAHSEANVQDYDSVTGEHLGDRPILFSVEQEPNIVHSAPLQSDWHDTEHSPRRRGSNVDQAFSLTSDTTASTIPEEPHTPPENMEILSSPISIIPPFAYPSSLEDTSAWPKPRRTISGSQARSYNPERSMSIRRTRRQSSRRSTSSMSPATIFLNRFAREEKSPEPDSEGQEVGEYVLGKQVGFGGFSTVREAFTLEGDEKICRAAKIVRKQVPRKNEAENDRLQAEFEHEVQLWRCLGHRNILPLIEVYDTSFATFCFTKLNTGGTLYDKIRVNRRGLGRGLARRYAYQLASAVRYLHEDVRIVHRDIKLENCLIDVSDPDTAKDGGNLLLCDFGLAEFIANDLRRDSDSFHEGHNERLVHSAGSPSEAAMSIAGSLQYASPELIMSPAGFLSPCVDVWAFGVVIYALLVGDLPFQHVFQPRVQMMILAGEWNVDALEKAQGVVGYEDEALEIAFGCLDMNSDTRWSVSQVLRCRWLLGMQEMLEESEGGFKL